MGPAETEVGEAILDLLADRERTTDELHAGLGGWEKLHREALYQYLGGLRDRSLVMWRWVRSEGKTVKSWSLITPPQ